MRIVSALFDAPVPARAAISALLDAGIEARDIAVFPHLPGVQLTNGLTSYSAMLAEVSSDDLLRRLHTEGIESDFLAVYAEGLSRGQF